MQKTGNVSVRPYKTIALCCLLCLLPFAALAQDDADTAPLAPDESRTVTLTPGAAVLLPYESPGDEWLRLTLHSIVPPGDDRLNNPVLAVRHPDGHHLAYNNDHPDMAPSDDADGEGTAFYPTDAGIPALYLADPGTYLVRVESYGRLYDGAFLLTAARIDPYQEQTETDGPLTTITGLLPPAMPYETTLSLDEGERLTLTLQDLGRRLDPTLRLIGPDGDTLAFNDDHNSADFSLDSFDSRISGFVAPAAGDYAVIVADFSGTGGRFRLEIQRER